MYAQDWPAGKSLTAPHFRWMAAGTLNKLGMSASDKNAFAMMK